MTPVVWGLNARCWYVKAPNRIHPTRACARVCVCTRVVWQVRYTLLATQGCEAAMLNVAWMLRKRRGMKVREC